MTTTYRGYAGPAGPNPAGGGTADRHGPPPTPAFVVINRGVDAAGPWERWQWEVSAGNPLTGDQEVVLRGTTLTETEAKRRAAKMLKEHPRADGAAVWREVSEDRVLWHVPDDDPVGTQYGAVWHDGVVSW